MFEKSIDQIEGFFPLIWCGVCGGYWYQIFKDDMQRIFEYDIYATIILFLVSLSNDTIRPSLLSSSVPKAVSLISSSREGCLVLRTFCVTSAFFLMDVPD